MTAVDIAEQQAIPEKYLVHILLQLKRSGLVRSVRGAQGGYLLAKSPDDITLNDMVKAIDGPVMDPLPADGDGNRDMAPVWHDVAKGIDGVLDAVTLRDILQRVSSADMYYI